MFWLFRITLNAEILFSKFYRYNEIITQTTSNYVLVKSEELQIVNYLSIHILFSFSQKKTIKTIKIT